jgi:hypothetical protein
MEKQRAAVYYITTGKNAEKKGKRLPIYKCSKGWSYAGEKEAAQGSPRAAGELWIYFSLLPENMGDILKKPFKRKKWLRLLQKSLGYAEDNFGCRPGESILFSQELGSLLSIEQTVPEIIYKAVLWKKKKKGGFRQLTLVLPKEQGAFTGELVLSLLTPYLPGINTLVFVGEETAESRELEEYLEQEYGILSRYEEEERPDSPCLNLCGEREMWNFLDTAVKSGYNTKVN